MLPNWGFRNTVHAFHSPKSVDLKLKGSGEGDAAATIPFHELMEQYVPEVADNQKFNLHPLLFNGALQTLYVAKANYSKEYQVYYGRKITDVSPAEAKKFNNMPPGQFTADYVVEPKEKSKEEFKKRYEETLPEGYPPLHPRCRYYTEDEMEELYKTWGTDDKPIMMISPGLSGGINEPQIRAVCQALFESGYHVIVLNCRGCCRSKITTPFLYCGLATDDMRLTVNRLHEKFPNKQIHLAGFSFGGLIIANYLAQEGDKSVVTAAVTVSSPWEMFDSATHMHSTLFGRVVFEPSIVYFLTRLVQSNREGLKQNPELFDEEEFFRLKGTWKNSEEFDDKYTSKLAGFPSAATYYLAASPLIRIFDIKTPMLVINSEDDPVISTHYPKIETKRNPYLYMATCDLGGHYSFITPQYKFWYVNVVNEFLTAFYNKVDQSTRPNDHGFHVKQGLYTDVIDLY